MIYRSAKTLLEFLWPKKICKNTVVFINKLVEYINLVYVERRYPL